MAGIEINDNKSEKDGHCEQEFKFTPTGQECTFSFSELSSKARFESCVGKHLRGSLQTCKVGNNLDKLEGLLKYNNSKLLGKILNGLIYILNHLLAQSKHLSKAIGFISFEVRFIVASLIALLKKLPSVIIYLVQIMACVLL